MLFNEQLLVNNYVYYFLFVGYLKISDNSEQIYINKTLQ